MVPKPLYYGDSKLVNKYTTKDIKKLIPYLLDKDNPSDRKRRHIHIGTLLPIGYDLDSFLDTTEKWFLYSVKFKEVPMYINVPGLKVFASWRLQIGK